MMRKALFGLLLLACAGLFASGCSLYRNDRCWLDREQYLIARDLFVESGSIDLVEKELERYEWQRCKINEVIYRLEKEFDVLPEEVEPAAGE